ncbi:MAG: FAD-dependent oxidoreductase [Deltaproteobacteria bacterium]|nr:FAD-dependent oxidoreductase [Deltaproteobacteria bacterium]MCL5277329.1 FAD-dependent oxidoreductase [Deltaproteobacteria bacterium]
MGVKRYVILGNSYAGVFAIEAIRKRDTQGEITVISREPYHVYARAAIHEYMDGAIDEARMYYRDKDFYDRHRVTTLLGSTVAGISPRESSVVLDSGQKVHFDRLMISTGGVPITPPIHGSEGPGMFTFTTWDDAKTLRDWIKGRKGARAVVIGGGLIGLQCAEGLKHMGVDVTVVELADYVLVKALDQIAAQRVQGWLEENGLRIVTGDTVESVLRVKGRVTGVRLKGGGRLKCDTVVLSIGVRPNTGPVEGSGIKVNRGIMVDNGMQTNIQGIFAAGDVAEAEDFLRKRADVIPIIPIATMQGKIAGSNMAGERRTYPGGLPQNAFQFFGRSVISIGNVIFIDKNDGFEEIVREEGEVYRKAVLKDGRLVGVLSMNYIARMGIYNSIIRARMDVSGIKDRLLSDSFGFLDLPKTFRDEVLTRPG